MKKSCKIIRILGVFAAIAAVIGFIFYCKDSDNDCCICKFIRKLFHCDLDEDDIEFYEEFEIEEDDASDEEETAKEPEETTEEVAEKKPKHKNYRGYITLDLTSEQ